MGNKKIEPSMFGGIGKCNIGCHYATRDPYVESEYTSYSCRHVDGCKWDCCGGSAVCMPWLYNILEELGWYRMDKSIKTDDVDMLFR